MPYVSLSSYSLLSFLNHICFILSFLPPPPQVGNMEFQLLSSKLQTCYGSLSLEGSDWGLQLYCPTLMQPCVARFRDNLWYRARITGQRLSTYVTRISK